MISAAKTQDFLSYLTIIHLALRLSRHKWLVFTVVDSTPPDPCSPKLLWVSRPGLTWELVRNALSGATLDVLYQNLHDNNIPLVIPGLSKIRECLTEAPEFLG